MPRIRELLEERCFRDILFSEGLLESSSELLQHLFVSYQICQVLLYIAHETGVSQ